MVNIVASSLRTVFLPALFLLGVSTSSPGGGGQTNAGARVPVVYCTDLFHPHDDPDGHFDLATLYALPELDVRGIVLDQGESNCSGPGGFPSRN